MFLKCYHILIIMIAKGRIIKVLNLLLVLLFALLIYKDPFSQRTLIPNFEPYPDTFNYIDSALNLVKGMGFTIGREGRIQSINVPPLYSISLVPFFVIKKDPRMAYYTNATLALISLYLFLLILKKILKRELDIFILLTLYTTNYFIYWSPSIIMAENLTLTLSLAAVYILLLKTSLINSVILSSIAVGIYATKFATLPISIFIVIIYVTKIYMERVSAKQRLKLIIFFISVVLFFYSILGLTEWITKGNNIFYQIFEHLLRIYNSIFQSSAISKTIGGAESSSYTSSWFGIEYIGKNLPAYINSLIGNPNRFLWDYTPLVPRMIAIPGLIGIFFGLFTNKYRFISLVYTLLISSLIIFMSTFYSFDARYIYIIIPMLLVGFGLFIAILRERVAFLRNKKIANILVVTFITFYLFTNFIRIKSQISLNLRYAETPWNYLAILKMNEYFTSDKIKNNKSPVLISALNPYLIDYFSNGNFTLLPLSYDQDLRGTERIAAWGPNDYSDLPKLYKKYLNEGYNVYVSRAGLGNEGYTNRDFNTIVEKFNTKLVQPGCYDQCNIYSVKLKETNGR